MGVGVAGEFDRSLTPEEIMDKLEKRVGPEGRKLFEQFLRKVNKLLFWQDVKVDGRMISINAEPEFWEQFRLIVMERGTTISELLAEIDRKHRLLPYPNAHPRVLALSAALRVFVLQELMAKLADAEARASRRDVRRR